MSTHPGQPKRRGLALTIIGAILMLLVAPAIFVVGIVLGVNGALDIVRSAPLVSSGETVAVQQGQTRTIYAFAGASDTSVGVETTTSSQDVPSCTVTGPSGAEVALTGSDGSSSWSRDSNRYLEAGSFTADQTGDYKIDCGDRQALVPNSEDAKKAGEAAIRNVGGGIAIASVLGLLGLILLIVGIVKLVNSGRERSQFRLQQQTAQWNQGGYGGHRY